MKKIIVLAVTLTVIAGMLVAKPRILVTSDAKLRCHAGEMKKSLEHSNRNYNGTIALRVFCQGGAVKYITTDKKRGSSQARYVPRNHVVYKICGNPCK